MIETGWLIHCGFLVSKIVKVPSFRERGVEEEEEELRKKQGRIWFVHVRGRATKVRFTRANLVAEQL